MRRARVRVRMRMRMGADPHRGMPVWVVLMRVSGRGAGRACRLQVTRHVSREASQLTRHRGVVITLPYRVTPSALLGRPPAVLLSMSGDAVRV